jgi:hypothetical protein
MEADGWAVRRTMERIAVRKLLQRRAPGIEGWFHEGH